MEFSFFLTVASLVFLIILIMTFYSKELVKSTSTYLYRILLILCLFFNITELITVLVSKFIKANILTTMLWKLHCGVGIFWVGILLLYMYSRFKKYKNEKIVDLVKGEKLIMIYAIVLCVITIISMVIPYDISVETLEFFPKNIMFVAVPFYAVVNFGMFYLTRNNDDKELKRLLISNVILSVVFFSLQGIITNVSLLPFMGVTNVYLIYFVIENPDIKILNEINDSTEEIEKSNQAKTDFLSNMSYEIKMPMNLIISLCDELNNYAVYDTNEVKDNIKQIVESGNKLLDIINNILDVSKIETGKDSLSELDYNINEVISNVITVAKQKIGAKPVKLLVNIDQSTSSILHGDSSKIYQSLLNIVLNAVKFTEVGKITITLSSTRSGGNEHLLFKVTDTGIGIRAEDQSKVFVKDAKINNTYSDEIGAGLGLVITKEYIDLLGGKIWFESTYRVGSTFYIEVAQKIVDATPLQNAKNVVISTSEKIDCSAYKVLIVDDNLLNIKVAKRLLEKYNFNVDSVTNGKDCIDKIKNEEKFDAIFMDHMMPEMDGIETLHVLQKLDGYTLPPIIALTANAIAGMKEMYLS